MARLKDFLEPGERVIYRNAVPFRFWVLAGFWTFLVVGFFAEPVLRYSLHEQPDVLFLLTGLALLIIGAGIAVGLGLMMSRFPAWAITDRRIVVLGGLLRRRRE